jgi:hypothetical protein
MTRLFGSNLSRTIDQAGVFVLLAPALLLGLATAAVGSPF